MFTKLKYYALKYPILAILGGGIILFLVYLIFNRLFGRREEEQPAQQLQVIPPDMRFQPPAPVGETAQWHQPFIEGQERLLEEMRGIGARLINEQRDPNFINEIIERVEERLPDRVAPTPLLPDAPVFTPLDPAPVFTPTPVPVIDERAITAIEADIARVEALRNQPDAISYFQRVWGGIDNYLAGQMDRWTRAVRGEQIVVGQPYQPLYRTQTPAAPVRVPEQHPPIRVAPPIQPILPRGAVITPPIQPVLPRGAIIAPPIQPVLPRPAPVAQLPPQYRTPLAQRPAPVAPRPAPVVARPAPVAAPRPSPVPPQMRPAPVVARPAPVAAPRPTPRPSPVPPQMRPAPVAAPRPAPVAAPRPAPAPPRVTVAPPRVSVPSPPRTTAAQRGAARIR